MIGKAIIGSTDISNLVVEGTYKVDMEEEYTQWEDGNRVKHRVANVNKLKGSFDVVLCDKVGMTVSELNSVVNAAKASTGAALCAFYCTNTGTVEAVNAFIHLGNSDHILTTEGFIDIITVEVEQI